MSEEKPEGMTYDEAMALQEPLTPTEESFIEILCRVWRVLKAADTELETHKNAIKALLVKHPELAVSLDEYLAQARQHPSLPEKMRQKYARVRGTLLQTLPDSVRERVLARTEDL